MKNIHRVESMRFDFSAERCGCGINPDTGNTSAPVSPCGEVVVSVKLRDEPGEVPIDGEDAIEICNIVEKRLSSE